MIQPALEPVHAQDQFHHQRSFFYAEFEEGSDPVTVSHALGIGFELMRANLNVDAGVRCQVAVPVRPFTIGRTYVITTFDQFILQTNRMRIAGFSPVCSEQQNTLPCQAV